MTSQTDTPAPHLEGMRFAIIGAGVMGRHHSQALRDLGHQVACIVDSHAPAAAQLAESIGASVCTWIQDIPHDVDGAIIATPTATHRNVAVEALRQGLHVFIEKPIASTLEDADEIIQTAEEINRVLCVGHIERFNPALIATVDWLSRSKARPYHISATRYSPLPKRIQDVGCILDIGIHDIDACISIMPTSPTWVDAFTHDAGDPYGREHQGLLVIGFEDNSTASIDVSWMHPERKRIHYIRTDKGSVTCDFLHQTAQLTQNGVTRPLTVDSAGATPMHSELMNFARAIATGERPTIDGNAARTNLHVGLTALQSSQDGHRIPLSLRGG